MSAFSNLMSNIRIGQSYDLHKLIKGNFILLGDIKIECDYNVVANSDGDILLHTISESILGALSLGDLGDHFNNVKGIKSLEILKFCLNKLKLSNYQIINIDNLIVLNHPKLFEYKIKIKKNLAKILNIDEDQVNIKVTTSENTKPLIIESHSVVLIEKRGI